MSEEQIARVAVQWWRNGGAKTEGRLYQLVDHFAMTYATRPGPIYPLARDMVQAWEWEVRP